MNARRSLRLRVLIDANVLISSLLSPNPDRSAAAALVQIAQQGVFDWVVPVETVEEITRVVINKPWLATRITPDHLNRLIANLKTTAELAPVLTKPPPRTCRDREDDYLIAQAMLAEANVLVTRDRDLLDLGQVGGVRIVDPATFLGLTRSNLE